MATSVINKDTPADIGLNLMSKTLSGVSPDATGNISTGLSASSYYIEASLLPLHILTPLVNGNGYWDLHMTDWAGGVVTAGSYTVKVLYKSI